MCDSIAEGGRRCTGQHLTIEQHANRADRRRAADRVRKSAKTSSNPSEQEVSMSQTTEEPTYLTVREVWKLLNVSPVVVRQLFRDGVLTGTQTDGTILIDSASVAERDSLTPEELTERRDAAAQQRAVERIANLSTEDAERYMAWDAALRSAQTEGDAADVYRAGVVESLTKGNPSLSSETIEYLADVARRDRLIGATVTIEDSVAKAEAASAKPIGIDTRYITLELLSRTLPDSAQGRPISNEELYAKRVAVEVTRSRHWAKNAERARETPIFVNAGLRLESPSTDWCVLASVEAAQGDSVLVHRADGSTTEKSLVGSFAGKPYRREVIPMGDGLVLIP